MVDADLDRNRRESVELAQQLLSVAHRGEVGFVITKPRINWFVRAQRAPPFDSNGDPASKLGRELTAAKNGAVGKEKIAKAAEPLTNVLFYLFSRGRRGLLRRRHCLTSGSNFSVQLKNAE